MEDIIAKVRRVRTCTLAIESIGKAAALIEELMELAFICSV